MTKASFLGELRLRLASLADADIQEALEYYEEMIDDRIEAGMDEEEAVRTLGTPRAAADSIMLDMPLSKIIKSKYDRKKEWRRWEIILLVLGSPVWIPLIAAAFAVFLSVYVVLWAVVLSVWAVDLSVAAVALGFIVSAFTGMTPASAFLYLGTALFSAGLSMVGFIACIKLSASGAKISLYIPRLIKSLLIGRRGPYENHEKMD